MSTFVINPLCDSPRNNPNPRGHLAYTPVHRPKCSIRSGIRLRFPFVQTPKHRPHTLWTYVPYPQAAFRLRYPCLLPFSLSGTPTVFTGQRPCIAQPRHEDGSSPEHGKRRLAVTGKVCQVFQGRLAPIPTPVCVCTGCRPFCTLAHAKPH